MKKIKIVKYIFIVWFTLIIFLGTYYLYYIFSRFQILTDKYIQLESTKEYNTFRHRTFEEYTAYLTDKFHWSLLSLLILFFLIVTLTGVLAVHLRNLYFFYVCNEEALGVVTFDNYRYHIEYNDLNGKSHKNHCTRNQRLYKKIFKQKEGVIDVFYNKYNTKNYIIGNKPTFLVESFLKPFFSDLIIFSICILIIHFAHPLLFLSVI